MKAGENCDSPEDSDESVWGPLGGPVNVKIADLGNACWVVSEPLSQSHPYSPSWVATLVSRSN